MEHKTKNSLYIMIFFFQFLLSRDLQLILLCVPLAHALFSLQQQIQSLLHVKFKSVLFI